MSSPEATPPKAIGQEAFLSQLVRDKTYVSVFLVSGVRLAGTIVAFDNFVVQIDGTGLQTVYKNAISTVMPTRRPSA